MIWTGILLLICHVIATIGSDNYLSWTKDVQHSANTVYDSDGNYRTLYTQQAKRNKAPVYAWSKLGKKLPTYAYRQQNRELPQAWQLQDRLALSPEYNLKRGNRLLPVTNAWTQAGEQYKDTNYQQLLDHNNPLQHLYRQGNQDSLNRLARVGNLNRGVDWNRLAKLGNLSHRYYLNRLAKQGKLNQVVRQGNLNQGLNLNQLVNRGDQVGLQWQQRLGYVNPNYLYNRLNQQHPLYLNRISQSQYNPLKNWKDYNLNYNYPSPLRHLDRQGYLNARKQHEWNFPPYRVNQDRQAYSLKLQDRLSSKNPSYSINRQNHDQVPTYSASALNLQSNGAWKRNRVPYSLGQRLDERYSNSVDQQNLYNGNLLNFNKVNGPKRNDNRHGWGSLGGSWGR